MPIMGDLISTSLLAGMGGGVIGAGAMAGTIGGGAYTTTGGSSALAAAAAAFPPRLSLILKPSFSSSNSVTAFFLIRSIMALMSFRSTAVCRLSYNALSRSSSGDSGQE